MSLVKHGTSQFDAAGGVDPERHTAPCPTSGAPVRVVLASQSPRRRALLAERGLTFEVHLPGFEDDHLRRGGRAATDPLAHCVSPSAWVASLAYLKARSTLLRLQAASPTARLVVIGADTVVVKGGLLIGKAASRTHALAIIQHLENGEHFVITGTAIVCSDPNLLAALVGSPTDSRATISARFVLVDRATVRVGAIGAARIAQYVESDDWNGKAGAYNLAERIAAGWPITIDGDPATVMGFPIQRSASWLDALTALQRQSPQVPQGVPA